MVNNSYPCKKQFGIKIIFDHVKLLKVVIGHIYGRNICCQTIEELICNSLTIKANGTAVVVVSVTRRSTRQMSRYFRQGTVTVQGGYGAVFAVMVCVSYCAIAVQVVCCQMISMFKRLVSCQGNFANTMTSLLPQLTVLALVALIRVDSINHDANWFQYFLSIRIVSPEIVFLIFTF